MKYTWGGPMSIFTLAYHRKCDVYMHDHSLVCSFRASFVMQSQASMHSIHSSICPFTHAYTHVHMYQRPKSHRTHFVAR